MKSSIVLSPFLFFFLFSCGGGSGSQDMAYESEGRMVKASPDQMAKPQPADLPERQLIRRASMNMEVSDYEEAMQTVRALTQKFEAEITAEQEQQYGQRLENRMTLRMPPAQLDPLMEALVEIARFVDSKSVEVEDVTQQYIDLETRLDAKRAVVQRYRELLEKAQRVQEILAVEEELRKVIEEIESTEQQLRYLQRQTGRSTLQLTIYEKTREGAAQRTFGSRVGNALTGGWQLLQNIVIGLITAWPVLILLGLFLLWWIRRRRRKQA